MQWSGQFPIWIRACGKGSFVHVVSVEHHFDLRLDVLGMGVEGRLHHVYQPRSHPWSLMVHAEPFEASPTCFLELRPVQGELLDVEIPILVGDLLDSGFASGLDRLQECIRVCPPDTQQLQLL